MQISLEKQGLNPGANWFQQLKKKVYGLNHNPKNRALGWFLVNRVELPGLVSLTNWSQLSTLNYKHHELQVYRSLNKYQPTPSNYIYAPFDLILSFHLFYWKILYEYSFSSFFLYLVFFKKIKRKLFLNFHYFFFLKNSFISREINFF